jgi:protein-disulfide isomerase
MQESDQRTRTLRLLGISAVLALVVVAVAIGLSQSGADDDDGGGSANAGGDKARRAAGLFEGIPQRGARLGDPDAPVRMVEFIDLQCPFCAQYSRDVLPTLVRRYVRPGKLSIELQPLAFLGEDSVTAAKATASAAARNRGWQFTEAFYANQGNENSGYVTPSFLRMIAREADVAPAPVLAASSSPVTPPLMAEAARAAQRHDVAGTPSFLLARRGEPLRMAEIESLDADAFAGPIDELLPR